MASVDGAAAAATMQSFGSWRPGYCLEAVWTAYARNGASTERSAGTATEGWERSDGKHRGDRNPPAGVPVWWGPNGRSQAGDVVISLGGGRVVATDWPGWGPIGVCTLDERERQIERPYLGWTESIFDQPINFGEGDEMNKAQEDKLNHAVKRIDAVYAAVFGPANVGAKELSWRDGPAPGSGKTARYGALPIVIHNQTLIAGLATQVAQLTEAVRKITPEEAAS